MSLSAPPTTLQVHPSIPMQTVVLDSSTTSFLPSLPIVFCSVFLRQHSTYLPQRSIFSHPRGNPPNSTPRRADALTARTKREQRHLSPPINRPPSRPISSYPFLSLAISPPRVGHFLPQGNTSWQVRSVEHLLGKLGQADRYRATGNTCRRPTLTTHPRK
ncbi:hypothetical protein BDP81DRAFT_52915 [Colletotrichum phormii]|uniref:Uncharacterized protein n=1 Tax=Colletotrichum phormii TaxID=359342 RepID=A0AAI9ZQA1_9PEZI|nr:uncharacterized protein BDP81DRAFT_52915 [Colletotrichum phormii]KAK1634772.1 hypothetical protein BDP81DRAFT_52915 [Colletotrichum phormii]